MKVQVDALSLDQLMKERAATEKILTTYMGTDPEVDKEIVYRARIRLAVLDRAIEQRKAVVQLDS